MFDVGRSMFDVHQFLFRFDRPFVWPAAGLTPETFMGYIALALQIYQADGRKNSFSGSRKMHGHHLPAFTRYCDVFIIESYFKGTGITDEQVETGSRFKLNVIP